jgi:hypothetical protein
LIQKLSDTLSDEGQKHLQMVLGFLGSTLPHQSIYADMCGDHRRPREGDLLTELVEMAESLVSVTGLGIDQVLNIDPLCLHPDLHMQIREELEK